MRMDPRFIAAFALCLACAHPANDPAAAATPVWVRSHNAKPVDVWVLCGENDATWLGRVDVQGSDAYAISAAKRRCAVGLNFFLVVRKPARGYWVGPLRPQFGSRIQLVIEKYAGLSFAQVFDEGR
jgi:hypothetical protein